MTDIQPILIDIADYEVAGAGANGLSYNHKTDPTLMLKLYNPGKRQQALSEMLIARKVYQTGIPTPEPGDFVTDGERYGIRFRRIPGKKSYARAVGDNPSRVAEYAAEFAQMCRRLHDTRVDTSLFGNVKDHHLKLLADNPFFTPDQKQKLEAFIRQTPDTDTALHGDLQFGNAIFDAEGHRYFIDLGDFAYGHPMFDLGMVYLCCKVTDPDFIREAFHMEPETAAAFWDAFAPVYFGPGADLAALEREARLYAGLTTLVVERDTKMPMTRIRTALAPLFE